MTALLFGQVRKNQPSGGDVHVTTVLGNERRSKAKLFRAVMAGGEAPNAGTSGRNDGMAKKYSDVSEIPAEVKSHFKGDDKKQRQWMHVFNSVYDAHGGDEKRAFAGAWSAVQKEGGARALRPMDDANSHSPFPHDPNAFNNLKPEHVSGFLGALTNQHKLPTRNVRLSGLVALQDRVDTKKVDSMRGKDTKPGLVIRSNNRNYIADGHHRLAAKFLDGHGEAEVHYLDLHARPDNGDGNSIGKNWELPINIVKMVPDQQLVFGWASVVEKDGQMIIDKQGDIIPVHEMESAVYDFVLDSRDHGDSHLTKGCGRMIESMAFTREKQDILKIDLGMQGWWTGFKVDSQPLWQAYKNGDRPEFSIGGQAQRITL